MAFDPCPGLFAPELLLYALSHEAPSHQPLLKGRTAERNGGRTQRRHASTREKVERGRKGREVPTFSLSPRILGEAMLALPRPPQGLRRCSVILARFGFLPNLWKMGPPLTSCEVLRPMIHWTPSSRLSSPWKKEGSLGSRKAQTVPCVQISN